MRQYRKIAEISRELSESFVSKIRFEFMSWSLQVAGLTRSGQTFEKSREWRKSKKRPSPESTGAFKGNRVKVEVLLASVIHEQ